MMSVARTGRARARARAGAKVRATTMAVVAATVVAAVEEGGRAVAEAVVAVGVVSAWGVERAALEGESVSGCWDGAGRAG